jgi:hypothetical protein
MSTESFNFDSLLDTIEVDPGSIDRFDGEESGEFTQGFFREAGYEGDTDYRIRQLSYSSLLLLHSCPRKFQLYKLRTTFREEERESQTITFAFGHLVGEAIQLALEGKSTTEIMWKMFLAWPVDIFARDDRQAKSLWEAYLALQRFLALRQQGFLKDYKLVYFQDKPACELSFAINLPGGYRYRGHVDAVLQHVITGKILVLECKTTSSKALNPSIFKNSAQAIGYSIVLDHLFKDLSSYEVLYLVYQTHEKDYVPIPFEKTYLQRALWIRQLLLDVDIIKMYEEAQIYPMHGESCVSFGRDCEYINHCTLSTKYLTKKATEKDLDMVEYQVTVNLLDLLDSQLERIET